MFGLWLLDKPKNLENQQNVVEHVRFLVSEWLRCVEKPRKDAEKIARIRLVEKFGEIKDVFQSGKLSKNSNGNKWYFLGKFPENLKIVKFPRRSTENSRNSASKIKWNRITENLGKPRQVALFHFTEIPQNAVHSSMEMPSNSNQNFCWIESDLKYLKVRTAHHINEFIYFERCFHLGWPRSSRWNWAWRLQRLAGKFFLSDLVKCRSENVGKFREHLLTCVTEGKQLSKPVTGLDRTVVRESRISCRARNFSFSFVKCARAQASCLPAKSKRVN